MLTQKDLDQIEELLDERLEEKFNDKLRGLPNKDEFYEKMDDVMGELKAIREEQAAGYGILPEHSDILENHETRLLKLETRP